MLLGSCWLLESKKQRIENDPSREVSAAEINELLEGISEDEVEGKTVSIAELNVFLKQVFCVDGDQWCLHSGNT